MGLPSGARSRASLRRPAARKGRGGQGPCYRRGMRGAIRRRAAQYRTIASSRPDAPRTTSSRDMQGMQ